MKKLIVIVILLSSVFVSCKKDKLNIYREVYEVEFVGIWSETTHPTDFPAGAHFSPMVALSHVAGLDLIGVGLLATEGVQSMAETGNAELLNIEFDKLRNIQYGLDKETGKSFDTPGSDKIQIGVERGRHNVTIFSMIAPSPDWFVAASTSLVDPKDGLWFDEVTVFATSYDAGTDSGLSFLDTNQATDPKEAVSLLKTGPLTEGTDSVQNMAKFIFRRIK